MKVTFLPAMRQVELPQGSTLLEAIWQAGLFVEASCGGRGTCGKCKVQVTKGNRKDFSATEAKKLSEEEKERGIRLACHCKVEEEMCVIIKERAYEETAHEETAHEETIHKKTTHERIIPEGDALNSTSSAESLAKQRVTGSTEDTQIEKTAVTPRKLGIAMDLGTTTVELQIYDMESKRRLISDRFMNPQRIYGADVISRITYCYKRKDRIEQLRAKLIERCNESIIQMAATIAADAKQIEKMVIVCNTTMSHILVGASVDSLAKSPFAMSFQGGRTFSTGELPFAISKTGHILVMENIGGHVGSDAFGCILALELYAKPGTHLLLDIGTNGEIVLAKDGVLAACSTAAGPAFEGDGIAYGMCAGAGAITKVAYDGKGAFRLNVVGNTVPVGISGSGVIDALACMLRKGVMDETGYIPDEYLTSAGGAAEMGYPLYVDPSQEENHVLVTRDDVRQIQMAKAAIYAGAISLLEAEGIKLKEVDTIYLAGAFGSHINVVNAIQIGLLPKVTAAKVKEVGNAAVSGAKEVLFDTINETKRKQVAKGVRHIELAEDESFKEKYIVSMNFFS